MKPTAKQTGSNQSLLNFFKKNPTTQQTTSSVDEPSQQVNPAKEKPAQSPEVKKLTKKVIKLIQQRISQATGKCEAPSAEDLKRSPSRVQSEEERRLKREAMQRARELMRITELPEGVELNSEVDEDESLRRMQEILHMHEMDMQQMDREEQELFADLDSSSSVPSVDEESGSPAKPDEEDTNI